MQTTTTLINQLLILAGTAQIVLVLVSPVIPHLLNWRAKLAKVSPIIRQMFWVYACYILVINLSFGLVSVLYHTDLTGHSNLAKVLTGFIAVYWITRLCIQFFCLDRNSFPAGKWHRLGEILLVSLFIFLSAVYTFACYYNYLAA